MCFRIDSSLQRPSQTVVWKVLLSLPQGLQPPYYSHDGNLFYTLGVNYALPEDIRTIEFHEDGKRLSREGIYVYLDEEDARNDLREWGRGYVVVECAVDPTQFLHQGLNHLQEPVATYRAFTPVRVVAANASLFP